jgi:hypothetical protein
MDHQVIRLGRRTFGGPSLSYMWEYQSQMRSSVAPKSFLIELKQLYMENSKSFAKSDDGFPRRRPPWRCLPTRGEWLPSSPMK